MTRYRLYCLDKQMHIAQQREFEAHDDAEAIAAVRLDYPDTNREIWAAHRKVATVPASRSFL